VEAVEAVEFLLLVQQAQVVARERLLWFQVVMVELEL
jgi:hypothetical protein